MAYDAHCSDCGKDSVTIPDGATQYDIVQCSNDYCGHAYQIVTVDPLELEGDPAMWVDHGA